MGSYVSRALIAMIGIPVFVLMIVPRVYRFYALKAARERKFVSRFTYEEEIINSGKVMHSEEFVQFKHRTLYRQTWSPADPQQKIKAVVLLAHGVHSYSGKMARMVLPLCEAGYAVVGFDHFGHGRSDGIHGYFPSVDYLAEDLNFHLTSLKKSRPEFAKLPLFKMGVSLGGLTCLLHAVKYPTSCQGMLLLCPAVIPNPGVVPPEIVLKIAKIINLWFPELPVSPRDKYKGFTDKKIAEEYMKDTRSYQGKNRSGSGIAMLDGMVKLQKNLHRVKDPFVVFHGTIDETTHIDGAKMLADKAQSKIKELVVLPEANHALMEEKPAVVSKILKHSVEFLDNQLANLQVSNTS